MTEQNRIQWIYSSQNDQELEERYDQWAADYEADVEGDFGWISPQRTSETFARHVPQEATILDAGAGTGLVGQCLLRLGLPEPDGDGPVSGDVGDSPQ